MALLSSRPELVEKFVLESVDLETLHRWVVTSAPWSPARWTRQRAEALQEEVKPPLGSSSLARWRVGGHLTPTLTLTQFSLNTDKRNMLEEMTGQLREEGSASKGRIMNELANCISAAVNADLVNVYLVETEGEISLFPRQAGRVTRQAVGSGRSIAAHCAKVKDIIRTDNSGRDPRFPLGVLGFEVSGGRPPPQGSGRVLCHPICSDEEELEAVLEFVRMRGAAFTEDDIEVSFHRDFILL